MTERARATAGPDQPPPVPPAPDDGSVRSQRGQWVDTMRVVVIAGVVVMHTTTAYLGGAGWFYTERSTSAFWSRGPVLVASVGALFGLAPLFLVAGSLPARSLAHKGPAAFVRGRLLRLGVPSSS